MLDKCSLICRVSPPTCKVVQIYSYNIMANNSSAEKRIRQTARRTDRNKALQSRVKTYRKQTLAAAAEGKKDAAQELFKKFASAVDICAKKKIFHKNKAANLKSKTAKVLKAA